MKEQLIAILRSNMGMPLNPELAADILLAADQIPTLVSFDVLDRIKPEQHGEFTFAHEKLEDILEEMRPLHEMHWAETGKHRHGIASHSILITKPFLGMSGPAVPWYSRCGRMGSCSGISQYMCITQCTVKPCFVERIPFSFVPRRARDGQPQDSYHMQKTHYEKLGFGKFRYQ